MVKEALRSLEGVDIYPIITLLLFFTFFVVLIYYVLKKKDEEIEYMANQPLTGKKNNRTDMNWE
jgi:preprotein translocase subunit YajC